MAAVLLWRRFWELGFLLLWGFHFSSALKTCDPGISCISLSNCPELLERIRSGGPENIRIVRLAICGFENKRSMVCCPSKKSVPHPTEGPPVLGNIDDLLPRLCGRPATEDKIIGGHPAPIGSYPWMAAIGYSERGVKGISFSCSGSIINSRYILTAGHCVSPNDIGRRKLEVLHLGDWDLSTAEDCQVTRIGPICAPPHLAVGVEEIVIHPSYNTRGRSSDDIALIRINKTLDFEKNKAGIEPVCLPKPGINVRTLIEGRRPVAAGWGLTEHGNYSQVMLRIDLPVADDELCRQKYQEDFVGNQLCIGGEAGSDTCSADSGGPLVLGETKGPPFTQIGIVSFGSFPCALQSFPGVYTSVIDYRKWIIDNIRP